jgi:elongation factor 1-beta
MADVVVTMRIMPESPEIDLALMQTKIMSLIDSFAGKGARKTETEPVAFGLKALVIMFVMAESNGSTEGLEKQIETVKGVNSVEVTDVRRTIG